MTGRTTDNLRRSFAAENSSSNAENVRRRAFRLYCNRRYINNYCSKYNIPVGRSDFRNGSDRPLTIVNSYNPKVVMTEEGQCRFFKFFWVSGNPRCMYSIMVYNYIENGFLGLYIYIYIDFMCISTRMNNVEDFTVLWKTIYFAY